MHLAYLVSVWLHLLAVIVWAGGMAFLVIVMVPWMRRGNHAAGMQFLLSSGPRFRTIGWLALGTLLITGVVQLGLRGVRLRQFGEAAWRSSPWGKLVLAKLAMFALVLAVAALHDFWVGPRATTALSQQAPNADRWRRRASHLGRLTAGLALLMLALGVMLVRGAP